MGQVQQQQMPAQNTYEVEDDHHEDGIAHDLIHDAGDFLGYWPLLGFLVLGVAVTFRKKIKKVLKEWLK